MTFAIPALKVPRIPRIPRTYLMIILIIILAAAALLLISATNPRALTRMAGPDYGPDQDSSDRALAGIGSGSKMELAFPFRTIYSPGDSFRVTLTLSNQLSQDKTFHMEVVQESGPEGIAPAYSGIIKSLPPGGTSSRNIDIATLPSSSQGTYLFKVLVCADGPCSGGRDPYSQGSIIFRLI